MGTPLGGRSAAGLVPVASVHRLSAAASHVRSPRTSARGHRRRVCGRGRAGAGRPRGGHLGAATPPGYVGGARLEARGLAGVDAADRHVAGVCGHLLGAGGHGARVRQLDNRQRSYDADEQRQHVDGIVVLLGRWRHGFCAVVQAFCGARGGAHSLCECVGVRVGAGVQSGNRPAGRYAPVGCRRRARRVAQRVALAGARCVRAAVPEHHCRPHHWLLGGVHDRLVGVAESAAAAELHRERDE
eukprot:ctg_2208.g491